VEEVSSEMSDHVAKSDQNIQRGTEFRPVVDAECSGDK